MNGYYNLSKKDCFNQLTLLTKSEMWVQTFEKYFSATIEAKTCAL